MKIVLIDGSPKVKNSTSHLLLEDVKNYIGNQADIIEIGMHKPQLADELLELRESDILVISCPLYVDGIPGHLLSCLSQLEKLQWQMKASVYGIVNCGFYEGKQAQIALAILNNWCLKSNLIWGGGIGVGGGGALMQMPITKKGHGPKAPIDKAVKDMVAGMLKNQCMENQYVSVAFPRFLYKMAAQYGWRQLIKSNGGNKKDLSQKWT